VKNNLGVFFVGSFIFFLIQAGLSGAAQIPILGILVSIASFVIKGPLMGGLLYLFLRGVRQEDASIEDLFSGFKRAFGQLFLAMFIQSLVFITCLLPFIVVLVMKIVSSGLHYDQTALQNDPEAAKQFFGNVFSLLLATSPVLLICALPVMYLSTCWQFTLPLIMDKGMNFWTAMMTSLKMVNKHWFQVFGLVLLIGLLNLAGIILCCLPVLFTAPIGFAALMYGYETIFGQQK
jgi:uncharacterized membrane protein